MDREQVLAVLRAYEPQLRAAGVTGMSLFGSLARGEGNAQDIDAAVRLDENFSAPGLDYCSRLDDLEERLTRTLGCKVDVVEEPVRKERFQREIDEHRAVAF
jgi:uncharacterized protein